MFWLLCNKAYAKKGLFSSSIADTMICFQISMSAYNLFYIKAYRNQNFMVTHFSDQIRKIILRHKRIGYVLGVLPQYACLVIYPITVDKFDVL